MKKDWILISGGLLSTLVLFAVPAYFYAHWLALILSFMSAGLFTFLMLKRNQQPLGRYYRPALSAIIVLYGFGAGSIIHNYIQAQKQDKVLTDIRHTIDAGIIGVQINNDMIQSLKYYKTSSAQEMTVTQAFRTHMGDLLNEDGSIAPRQEGEDENMSYFYEVTGPDTVRIIAVTQVSGGEDPEFQNYDGQYGKSQFEGILTNEGVEYEKVN